MFYSPLRPLSHRAKTLCSTLRAFCHSRLLNLGCSLQTWRQTEKNHGVRIVRHFLAWRLLPNQKRLARKFCFCDFKTPQLILTTCNKIATLALLEIFIFNPEVPYEQQTHYFFLSQGQTQVLLRHLLFCFRKHFNSLRYYWKTKQVLQQHVSRIKTVFDVSI